MFIKASDIDKAISRVRCVASLDKAQPGVLFDIRNDAVDVYYNTSQKAVISTVPATVDESELHGKVVFDYKRLTDTLEYCKSVGSIKVENIEFIFNDVANGSGICNINVVKTVEVSDGDDVHSQVVGKNKYDLSWWGVESLPMKQKILAQPACENMFNDVGGESWSASELRRVLSDASSGDAKVIYMSATFNGAFAVNTNSGVIVKTSNESNKTIHLNTSSIKALCNIISTLDTDDVVLNTIYGADGKLFACIVFTPDHSMSFYIGAAPKSNTHIAGIGKYAGLSYRSYQSNIMTEVIKDSLKAAANLSASTKGKITFTRCEDNSVDAVFVAENTGASVNNTYKIKCVSFNSESDIGDSDEIFKFNIDFKLLYDIVCCSHCDYTGLDIDVIGDEAYLRVGFFDIGEAMEAMNNYKEANNIESMEISDKINIRNEYIETSYFAKISKA